MTMEELTDAALVERDAAFLELLRVATSVCEGTSTTLWEKDGVQLTVTTTTHMSPLYAWFHDGYPEFATFEQDDLHHHAPSSVASNDAVNASLRAFEWNLRRKENRRNARI